MYLTKSNIQNLSALREKMTHGLQVKSEASFSQNSQKCECSKPITKQISHLQSRDMFSKFTSTNDLQL